MLSKKKEVTRSGSKSKLPTNKYYLSSFISGQLYSASASKHKPAKANCRHIAILIPAKREEKEKKIKKTSIPSDVYSS